MKDMKDMKDTNDMNDTKNMNNVKDTKNSKKFRVGTIGAGNMGGALLSAAVRSVGKENAALYDIDEERQNAAAKSTGASAVDLDTLLSECRCIFLAVKPAVLGKLLSEIKDKIPPETLLVSMAAGVSLSDIIDASSHDKVIRIMPNTPVSVGEGMILYCPARGASESDVDEFLEIVKYAGKTDRIDEGLIDAAAALSGCAPAFVYMFCEALADGAVACGLPRDRALRYACQTVLGAAALAEKSKKHPGALKDEVCSPGGTTIEGVRALEQSAFRSAAAEAVIAAYEKTARLKK